MARGQRVLVTGASGFIGARALDRLVETGYEVHAVSARHAQRSGAATWHRADLLDPAAAERLIARVSPQALLHFAWYAEPGRYWNSPENVRWVEATLRLLRAFTAGGGRRAVLAGTCAEYRWGRGGFLREDETPLEPATFYGTAKHATHLVAGALADELGLSLAWGRIFFLYGPGESQERLVASMISGLLQGRRVPTTPGLQVRDFMHVDDVAKAFVALVDSKVAGAVNIGAGRGVAVRELVAQIGAATAHSEGIEWGGLPARPDDPPSIIADARRLRYEVGFKPSISLEDGIARTVEWWSGRLGANRPGGSRA